jgi:amidase
MTTRLGIARAWSLFFADYPLVLSPTWTQLPFEIGADESPDGARASLELFRPVLPANLLGLPSVCVPAALDTSTGLPIGVLVTGDRFTEGLCLDAAAVIEQQSPVTTPVDPAV